LATGSLSHKKRNSLRLIEEWLFHFQNSGVTVFWQLGLSNDGEAGRPFPAKEVKSFTSGFWPTQIPRAKASSIPAIHNDV
jgi:hypothetical protein